MTDTTPQQPPIYDDDRLLAYALELDDDPELARALEADEVLRDRLTAISDDLHAVRDGLDALASPSEPDSLDLASPRWAPLHRHLKPRPRRTRLRLRLNTLVPVFSLVLAIAAAGAAIIHETMQSPATTPAETTATNDAANTAATAKREAAAKIVASPKATTAASLHTSLKLARRIDRAGGFGLILIATAQRPTASTQPFLIVSSLRGSASGLFSLKASGRPVPKDGLYLLLLRPSNQAAAISSAMNTAVDQLNKSPSHRPTPSSRSGEPLVAIYSYADAVAIAISLPLGTNPGTVHLP